MNRKDIIQLAREAGLYVPQAGIRENGALTRFADLVAAAERDAILKILRNGWFMTQKEVEVAIRARGNNDQS